MAFDPMNAADEFAKHVEAMTGLKAQFEVAGWTAEAAEQMVILSIRTVLAESR